MQLLLILLVAPLEERVAKAAFEEPAQEAEKITEALAGIEATATVQRQEEEIDENQMIF